MSSPNKGSRTASVKIASIYTADIVSPLYNSTNQCGIIFSYVAYSYQGSFSLSTLTYLNVLRCFLYSTSGCVHFFSLHQLQLGWHFSKEEDNGQVSISLPFIVSVISFFPIPMEVIIFLKPVITLNNLLT